MNTTKGNEMSEKAQQVVEQDNKPDTNPPQLPGQQLTSILQMVERVATNPEADMDKLERLLDMQERVLDRESKMAFSRAMSAAQSEMGRVAADAINPQTHSKYATYGSLDRAIRPVYTKHGFALSFDTGDAPLPDQVRVMCDVSHIDGYTRSYHVDMPADGKGAKGGDVMTKTHAAGAAMSYGMRYLLKMIFNIAIGEDDKDGNVPVERITEQQAADLESLAEEVGADIPKFLKYLKIESLDQLPASWYDTAVKALEAKRKEKKA